MKCWHCEEELLWKGDDTIEDDNEEEYMVTNLSCPGCDADVEIYLKDKKGRAGHGK
tara:strand:+ start:341 stop:508 length:168 start_codon:yes stop_codon:yes gene_type:complete